MPTKSDTTTTRKRKKAEDMAESPPKRVTRAKAAKSATDNAEGPKSTRITTASARIAAEAKAAAASKTAPKTTRSTKRKPKTEEKSSDVVEVDDPMEEIQPAPVKTRGRPKKTDTAVKENVPKAATSKTRQTKARGEQTDTTAEEKPKTRATRSRATKESKSIVENTADQPEAKTAKRSTRARAGTLTSEAEQPPPVKAKTIKKVTFQDDVSQDKENAPAPRENAKKGTVKETGLRAKPVRRPAPARATTRATKTITASARVQKTAQPLSPKKIVQVAKSSSISSEDELSKSPVKAKPKTVKPSPEKDGHSEDLEDSKASPQSPIAKSPAKPLSQTLLGSPAKRPPLSPFKESLKEFPKKFVMNSPRKVLGEAPDVQTQFKDSLKRSPKKLGFTPLKAKAQDSMSYKVPAFGRSGFLDSPARRPNSPLKVGSLKMPGKSGAPMPITNTTSALRHMKSSSLFSATPKRLFGTPLKASKGLGFPPKTADPSPDPVEEEIQEHALAAPIEEEIEDPPQTLDANEAHNRTSPIKAPQIFEQDIFSDTPNQFRFTANEDSEDELISGTPTMRSPIKNVLLTAQGVTPARRPMAEATLSSPENAHSHSNVAKPPQGLGMTPLAVQMSNWFAASPTKDEEAEEEKINDVFMPVGAMLRRNSENASRRQTMTPPESPAFFDEQMGACDSSYSPEDVNDQDLHMTDEVEGTEVAKPIQQSQESDQYGDENELPQMVSTENVMQAVNPVTQSAFVTPAKVFYNRPQVIHTTSKVPLKGAEEDSPSELKVPKKRSKSLAGPLVELNLSEDPLFAKDVSKVPNVASTEYERTITETPKPIATPKSPGKLARDARTPSIDLASIARSPAKSVRKGSDAQILRGAVVHVDVHTTEGADASGIFVELLTSMGAKCIKQWTWNPRTSLVAGEDPTAKGKVGITHVVFKDGSKRTLQKVREAKGLVLCIGVGWVLE